MAVAAPVKRADPLINKATRIRLRSLARSICGNYRTNLVWGDSSCTDGKTIWINPTPWFFTDKSLAVKYCILRAMAIHEALHILFTNFAPWKTFQQDPELVEYFHPEVIRAFGNGLEDARIEFHGSQLEEGAKKWLRLSNVTAVRNMPVPEEITGAVVRGFVARAVAGILPPGFAEAWPQVVEYLDEIEPLIESGRRALTTKECLDYAKEILLRAQRLLPKYEKPEFDLSDLLPEDIREGLKGKKVTLIEVPGADPRLPPKKAKSSKAREDAKKERDAAAEEGTEMEPSDAGGSEETVKKEADARKGSKDRSKASADAAKEDADAEGTDGSEGDATDMVPSDEEGDGAAGGEPGGDEEEDAGEGSGADTDGDAGAEAEDGSDASASGADGDAGEDGDSVDADGSGTESGDSGEGEGSDGDLEGESEAGEDGSDSASDDCDTGDAGEDTDVECRASSSAGSDFGHPSGISPDSDLDEDISAGDVEPLEEEWSDEEIEKLVRELESLAETEWATIDGSETPRVALPETEEADFDFAKVEAEIRKGRLHKSIPMRVVEGRPQPSVYQAAKTATRVITQQIVTALKPLVVRQTEDFQTGRRSGSLDVNRLWRVPALHETRVFMARRVPYNPAIAIYLLGDASGSMGAGARFGTVSMRRDDAVRLTLVAFAEALEELKIVHAVSAFDEDFSTPVVNHRRLLKFGQKSNRASIVDYRACQNNRDGYSIRLATAELKKRPEPVKLLFVLSDGEPAAYRYGGESAINDTALAVREARAQGIEVVGFFFGDASEIEAERRMFSRERLIIVDNLGHLPNDIAAMFKRLVARYRG